MKHALFAPIALLLLTGLFSSAKTACPDSLELLDTLRGSAGESYRIYSDGKLYGLDSAANCTLVMHYFDPAFRTDNYLQTDTAVYQFAGGSDLLRLRNAITENFEGYSHVRDCIMRTLADSAMNWTGFMLQSPLAKTTADFVALRMCIMDSTCDFRDNRIDLIVDPLQTGNRCIRFLAVAPAPDMVTSKSSMENTFLFFVENDTLLFEGRFLVQSGMPVTIADFESKWFEVSPGPRIILSNGALAVEQKYGNKPIYRQRTGSAVPFPVGSWVHVRLRMAFRPDNSGLIRLWQDGTLVLDTVGRTLPLRVSVQTDLEIGISATGVRTELCVDDIVLERRAYNPGVNVEHAGISQPLEKRLSLRPVSGFDGPALRMAYSVPGGESKARFTVADVRGRILIRTVFQSEASGHGSLSLRWTSWPAGIYFCRLETARGAVGAKAVKF